MDLDFEVKELDEVEIVGCGLLRVMLKKTSLSSGDMARVSVTGGTQIIGKRAPYVRRRKASEVPTIYGNDADTVRGLSSVCTGSSEFFVVPIN